MAEITVASSSPGNVHPEPSVRFSARELCELVLGQIGAFTVNDEEPNAVEMERTLHHMELLIAEIAGTELNWWMLQDTYRFVWPTGVRKDTIANIMGSVYPSLGIIMPLSAYLIGTNGIRMDEIPIVRRHVIEDVSNRDQAGRPQMLYFNRFAPDPTMEIHPVPDATQAWSIDLTAQTYAPSVLGNQYQTDQSGNVRHIFAVEWQNFLVNATAAVVGNGPVRRVDLARVKDWRDVSETCRSRLEAWSNREKRSQSNFSRTRRWG